jgi:saccharopine dehydrogenase-like NADP-dependent oxidoreductase
MKITVIGAAGNMARSGVLDLVESSDVKAIQLVDINVKFLEKLRVALKSKKVSTAEVDITDQKSLVRTVKGSNVVMNATTHYYNLGVMKACLEVKAHYVDLGGLFHWAREQMLLNDEFKKAGLTAILGCGSAPGIVNVMARYAYDRLDEIEYVRIRDGIVNFTKTRSPLAIPYSLQTILDEFLLNPYIFENGEWVELRPFARPEVVDFPEPVGRQTTFATLHSEVATIPVSFKNRGIKEVSFKLSLPKEFEQKLRFLIEIGFGSTKTVSVGGKKVAPREVLLEMAKWLPKTTARPDDHKVLWVDAAGRKDGKEVEYRLESIHHPYAKWNMRGGAFGVGFPLAVGARMLGSGQVKERGAMGPERAIQPEIFFGELAKRELEVTVMLKHKAN